MHRIGYYAQKLFNVPLLIHPDKAELVMFALAEKYGVTQMVRINGDVVLAAEEGVRAEFGGPGRSRNRDTGYDLAEGVAKITIEGTLVNKTEMLRPYSGMTGYDGIRQNYLTALDDPEVKAIALDIESPGGEAAGCFDLADLIYETRGEKPVWAILTEYALSSAYAIASAADKIILPRTGSAGSIGAYYMHVDFSKAVAAEGIKVTFISYGDRKLDGQPLLPLPKEAVEKIQSDIDAVGDLFVEMVARNRKLSTKKVRDTEAGTFRGDVAVTRGLADAVMAPDAAFRALLAELN